MQTRITPKSKEMKQKQQQQKIHRNSICVILLIDAISQKSVPLVFQSKNEKQNQKKKK